MSDFLFPSDRQGMLVKIDSLPLGTSLDNVFYYQINGSYYKKVVDGAIRASAAGIYANGQDMTSQINGVTANPNIHELVMDVPGAVITVNGTVTLPKDFVLKFTSNCSINGTGTISGGVIQCDYLKQCFGTSLTVTGLLNTEISVVWFGAVADSITDNLPIFQSALSSGKFNAAYYIPANLANDNTHSGPYYYFSGPLVITNRMKLYGDGQSKTVLSFPNSEGFIIQGAAVDCEIRDLKIKGRLAGENANGYNSYTRHGAIIRARGVWQRVWIAAFDGDGFHVEANSSLGQNANNARLLNCIGYWNGRHGFYFFGPDANNIEITNCDASLNKRHGFADRSFLGNSYYADHAATNGTFESGGHSWTTHNSANYICLINNGGNLVTNGGHHYKSIHSDDGIRSYTPNVGIEPGVTSGWASYWQDLGVGTVSTQYPAWDATLEYPGVDAVEPGVTTGWQTYWSYQSTTTNSESYDVNQQYFTGFGYSAPGLSHQGGFYGCYTEGDNNIVENYGNVIIGGFLASYGQAPRGIASRQGVLTTQNFQVYNESAGAGVFLNAGDPDSIFNGIRDDLGGGYQGFVYDRINRKLGVGPNQFEYQQSQHWFVSSSLNATSYIGRSAYPVTGAAAFNKGVWLQQAGGTFRMLGFANGIPVSGEYAVGDYFLDNSSGSALAYACTVSGSPGTWVTKNTGSVSGNAKMVPDANYTVAVLDKTLILPNPAATRTLTLPAANTMQNKDFTIHVKSDTTGEWMLSGSFVQKGTFGDSTIVEDFVNGALVNLTTYHLVSVEVTTGTWKWFSI